MPQLATESVWSDPGERQPASSADARQSFSFLYLRDEQVAELFAREVFAWPWVTGVAYLTQENGLKIWTFMADVENEEQQEQVLGVEEDFFAKYGDREFGFRMVPMGREIPGATLLSRKEL